MRYRNKVLTLYLILVLIPSLTQYPVQVQAIPDVDLDQEIVITRSFDDGSQWDFGDIILNSENEIVIVSSVQRYFVENASFRTSPGIVIFDSSGQVLNAKTFEKLPQMSAVVIEQTTDSGYLIGGFERSNRSIIDTNEKFSNIYLIKITENLDLEWFKKIEHLNQYARPLGILENIGLYTIFCQDTSLKLHGGFQSESYYRLIVLNQSGSIISDFMRTNIEAYNPRWIKHENGSISIIFHDLAQTKLTLTHLDRSNNFVREFTLEVGVEPISEISIENVIQTMNEVIVVGNLRYGESVDSSGRSHGYLSKYDIDFQSVLYTDEIGASDDWNHAISVGENYIILIGGIFDGDGKAIPVIMGLTKTADKIKPIWKGSIEESFTSAYEIIPLTPDSVLIAGNYDFYNEGPQNSLIFIVLEFRNLFERSYSTNSDLPIFLSRLVIMALIIMSKMIPRRIAKEKV